MLKLEFESTEYYDQTVGLFIEWPKAKLKLEHSLASLSKWESIHKKPFLNRQAKTVEEILSYIECMALNKLPPGLAFRLNSQHIEQVEKYLSESQTATTFVTKETSRGSGEGVTAEVIYYWMISSQVPFTPCENWHLDKLLTLLRVISVKNAPKKKMSRSEIAARNRSLNAQRRQQMNSTG